MKRIIRSAMLVLVAGATYGAVSEPVEARRNLCNIQERWYYQDSSCTGDHVGYTNFDCNGSPAGGWGTQTSHFDFYKEIGSVCGCSGGDDTDSGSVGCSR
jgi:hypothetical protein